MGACFEEDSCTYRSSCLGTRHIIPPTAQSKLDLAIGHLIKAYIPLRTRWQNGGLCSSCLRQRVSDVKTRDKDGGRSQERRRHALAQVGSSAAEERPCLGPAQTDLKVDACRGPVEKPRLHPFPTLEYQ